MSAARLLAWLWAAVWVRWRLAVVRTRRALGGRPTVVGAGPGYHLPPADVPVDGVDYDVDELPPELLARLEDTRADLLHHARTVAGQRGRRQRARRRRVVSLVTAAVVTLTALGAGATALMTGSTGVPEVDRWLGIYEAASDEQKVGGVDVSEQDVRPAPSEFGPPVQVRIAGRSSRTIVTAYVSRSGDVCATIIESDHAEKTGNISCVSPSALGARLERDGGAISGSVSVPDGRVLVGFVTSSVHRVSVRGREGVLDVRLGRTWTPDVSGVGALRTFVAAESGAPPVVNPRDYVVRLHAGHGRSTEMRP